jgi:hypothetical protein
LRAQPDSVLPTVNARLVVGVFTIALVSGSKNWSFRSLSLFDLAI